jgi:hypothetical protein
MLVIVGPPVVAVVDGNRIGAAGGNDHAAVACDFHTAFAKAGKAHSLEGSNHVSLLE